MATLPTKRQQELLRFIDGFIKGNGYGPSYREMMRALGYKSVSTVAAHVQALIAKGYLEKPDEYSARSLAVTTPDQQTSVVGGASAEAEIRARLAELTAGEAPPADITALERALELLGYANTQESAA